MKCCFDHLLGESHRDCRESGMHGSGTGNSSRAIQLDWRDQRRMMGLVSNSAGESGTDIDRCPRRCRSQKRHRIANRQDRLCLERDGER